jgi:Uma2 family endonuclease
MATTTTAPITLEEFERLPDDGNKHELSDGELIVTPPAKFLHTLVAAAILDVLHAYLRQHRFAGAFAEAGYVLSQNPLLIRQPDISILSNQRISAAPKDGWVERSPELAVEIVSPSDSAQDLEIKVEQYLRYGAQQVWVFFPKQKQVHIHQSGAARIVLNESETLTGGDLLPGFSVKVADLFTF